MSASPKTACASGRMRAPWERYSSSAIAEPSPAPACTTTSCPCSTSSRTPAGVSATRYSSVLISVGTPTFIQVLSLSSSEVRACEDGGRNGFHYLAATQRQPEVDAIARGVQRAPGELLHAADPIAQGVAVTVERTRGTLPLAVALNECLQRAH